METQGQKADGKRAAAPSAQPASAGRLKIFFGYAQGVGKTYAMLEAAHSAKDGGADVVAGYVETHNRPQTAALLTGLEKLPLQKIQCNGLELQELDLDAAMLRKPRILLVDDLAHVNAPGSRHLKRYQDVAELLKAGIDVYTTVNVQHIESLNDTVAAITGVRISERIPDSIFDGAEQVELIDIEPQELMERLAAEGAYTDGQEQRIAQSAFSIGKLTALREIALRRCADRVNRLTEYVRVTTNAGLRTDEHILVCLSSAPSNGKIIRTAARMAAAFKGRFSALFVKAPDFSTMSEENKERLRANTRLAQQLGAQIETVYGDDIAFQIAEFARLTGATKIVIGRSTAKRRWVLGKPTLTEELIEKAPNLDVHIIPDGMETTGYPSRRSTKMNGAISVRDIGRSIGILLFTTLLGFLFSNLGFTEANIITIYTLAVLVISVVTSNRAYSLVASIVSVLVFNFFFTVPRFTFRAYDRGYPITFAVMFLAALIMGSLAARLKEHAKQSAQAAYRTKVLLDTNQLLQRAHSRDAILAAMAGQLVKLLNRDVITYLSEKDGLGEPLTYPLASAPLSERYTSESERSVAAWVEKNNKHAGATTDTLSDAKCLYLAIRGESQVYAVAGIVIDDRPLDIFENGILLSVLGECALALENEKNAREKETAAVIAKNEQLRANLLRTISHDLRTPLTAISGNASNLASNGDSFDDATKKQIYSDIYDDSMWLINLVENLLSVTRIEEGRMNLNMTAELMDEVIAEALRHINRKSVEHHITVVSAEDYILAQMDPKLIVQVLINLVDNAIKYTPPDSNITITTEKRDGKAIVRVADDGAGISDEGKAHVFDMFYTGKNQIGDSRRSLGLGLSLCKSIVQAHGGQISISDNLPHGAVFTFTLPAGEVILHE
ncbi:MAG: sensor histidine kinase KdpD [Eubacteriales bacterium]|nr:sensor histidine kinase KdpD [Eubacteriales bacterium]